MKKVICLILILYLLLMTGCIKENDEPQITISVAGWPIESEGQYYTDKEKMRTDFMEKYPDIYIERASGIGSSERFVDKAASGRLPSLYNMAYTEVEKIVNAGYAADITKYMEKYHYTEYLQDEILDIITVDGKIYAIPMTAYIMGLMVNKELFREAGFVNEDGTIIFPETMEEMAEMASEIKEKTGKNGFMMPCMSQGGGWHFLNIVWAFGGDFMEKRDNKWIATFDSSECVEALQFVKDLRWKYNACDETLSGELISPFASGEVAMIFGVPGVGEVRRLKMLCGMDKDLLAMGLMPAGPEGRHSQLGGGLYFVNSNCTEEQIDAIFKWLAFDIYGAELTEDNRKSISDTYKGLARDNCAVGVKNYSFWESGPIFEYTNDMIEQYTNIDVRDVDDYSRFDEVTIHPEPPVNAQELYSVIDSCIQEVLTNEDADVKKILERASDDFQKYYLDDVE